MSPIMILVDPHSSILISFNRLGEAVVPLELVVRGTNFLALIATKACSFIN